MYGEELGVFIVEGEEISVSDPGYREGDRGYHTFKAKDGQWMAAIEYKMDGSIAKPARLSAAHIDYTTSYEDHPFFFEDECGVDSGQMSIWCTSDYSSDQDRYDAIGYGDGIEHHGTGTLGEDFYYLDSYGVASRTFSGDGCYVAMLFVEEYDIAHEEDGTVIAIEIAFA